MSQSISIKLSDGEKGYLFDLVRNSLERGVEDLPAPHMSELGPAPQGTLRDNLGAFVTLHKHGQLRGCIGMIQSGDPLYYTVSSMAWAAAFRDSRFPPVRREELAEIKFDISILGPLSVCSDIGAIETGKHGLLLETQGRRSVFLPQVPVEQGWDVRTTLEHLGRKAGLPASAWQSPGARIYWYEAVQIEP